MSQPIGPVVVVQFFLLVGWFLYLSSSAHSYSSVSQAPGYGQQQRGGGYRGPSPSRGYSGAGCPSGGYRGSGGQHHSSQHSGSLYSHPPGYSSSPPHSYSQQSQYGPGPGQWLGTAPFLFCSIKNDFHFWFHSFIKKNNPGFIRSPESPDFIQNALRKEGAGGF